MIIRAEKIKDYNGISNINYEAFHNWKPENPFVKEGIIVDILRHNSMFDPELSLVAIVKQSGMKTQGSMPKVSPVAEEEGKIIGHVMFSPFIFTIKGKEEKGVILAPISVSPEYQKSGIGGLLIEEGHRILKEKGYTFSLLCGHAKYYPQFGYIQSTFALNGCKVTIDKKEIDTSSYKECAINSSDINWITNKWMKFHSDDEFALMPGDTISDWYNHGSPCFSSIIYKDNKALGYVRYQPSKNITIKEILADESDLEDVLLYLSSKSEGVINLMVSYDKVRSILNNSDVIKVEDNHVTNDAFMIKVLDENSRLARYVEDVISNKVRASVISFPPVFDIEEC